MPHLPPFSSICRDIDKNIRCRGNFLSLFFPFTHMEKSDSFTLDDAMQLLRGNEDDYAIGVASSFGVDQEKFEQEGSAQAKIAILRATQRQSVFAVMRTEKQMGTLAFEDVEKDIQFDPEHQGLLDQCRSMKEYIHA